MQWTRMPSHDSMESEDPALTCVVDAECHAYGASHAHRMAVGLLVPVHGTAGIWGPSARACAELAVEELNRGGGLLGRELHLQVFNATEECCDIAEVMGPLVREGELDAIVGMHTSGVRSRVSATTGGRIPFIYTPLYEGGETTPGVYAIGETPDLQLLPALRAMYDQFGARRWVFVGNDYVWPHTTHRLASRQLRALGGELLADCYVPSGCKSFTDVLEVIDAKRPDAVLLSLIGQDAVHFNREFAAAGMRWRPRRLSCAIEENGLLAIGAEHTDGLFVAAGYFSVLATDANMAFKERYHARYGERAPVLNALGQSAYDGMYFLAALIGDSKAKSQVASFAIRSVRERSWDGKACIRQPVFLAEAQGHFFNIVRQL